MFWENFFANLLSSIVAGIVLGTIGVGLYKDKTKNYINNTISQNIKKLKSETNYNYCNIDKIDQGINKTENVNFEDTKKNSADSDKQKTEFENKQQINN